MRFLQGNHIFHEKMTFGYRFVHACCIHTHIVGNAPDRKQVFAIENNSGSMHAREESKLWTGYF